MFILFHCTGIAMDIQDVEHSQTDSLKCKFSDILSCYDVGHIGFKDK